MLADSACVTVIHSYTLTALDGYQICEADHLPLSRVAVKNDGTVPPLTPTHLLRENTSLNMRAVNFKSSGRIAVFRPG